MGGGNQGVLWDNQGRDGFCRGFHCPIVCMHLLARMRVRVPASIFLVAASACVSPFSSQERLISPYLSHDRHCFPFPGDTGAFVIQVAGIVTSGAAAWEDGGQEYHVLRPPPSLMKSIRCAAAAGTETRGQKTQVDTWSRKTNTEKGDVFPKDGFLCALAAAPLSL